MHPFQVTLFVFFMGAVSIRQVHIDDVPSQKLLENTELAGSIHVCFEQ